MIQRKPKPAPIVISKIQQKFAYAFYFDKTF